MNHARQFSPQPHIAFSGCYVFKSNQMSIKRDNALISNYEDLKKSLRVEVKIPNDEVDRVVVNKLISFRKNNKYKDAVDKILLGFFLSEKEFKEHVIDGVPIEY